MYLTHITTEGERWDQLAWKYYGNALEYERIVAANPQVPITPTLLGGLRLSIPVIEETQIVEDLPPWKR
ncbi:MULTISPECIES: tail protein X [Comamonas]|uniref:Membrane protein n=1 Tax=Comamonas thiooxydans TaxID=363952 RepID=A0A0E3BR37_9BURK|nr:MULTISPECIES: tail protein X [Comamonas]KGH08707.1 membrane protein [Comamonas thiooxydans]KGH16308.1 membrane protein [Comamonas thiooxydans]KGH20463.1 membrane protein [Comamonas thiooxydans]KKI12150.1 membrane protein [Comamonas thiooxydans]